MKKNCLAAWDWTNPGLHKFLRIMKFSIFILMFSVAHVFATSTYSQSTELDINMSNRTLREVLRNIEEQSEFYFMYSEKVVDVNRIVSVEVENQKVGDVLDQLFAGTDVEYWIEDRFILLTTPEFGGASMSVQEQAAMSGTVRDENGSPLPGVSVVVKGTLQGTVSDQDGFYSFLDALEGNTLVFSFVGMKSQEVIVGAQTVINVILENDLIGLEELVVVGYGVQRKSDLTGAVSSVKSDQLNEIPLARVDQALQGKVAGVTITNTDGAPGGNVKIRIRGANSVNGQNEPLVVVDGFIGGDLNAMNPSDIESIEVLKDASATAIYGSRGANGVILVTTKTGRKGKPEVSVSTYLSNHKRNSSVAILEAWEYANLLNEKQEAFNRRPIFEEEEVDSLKMYGGTDWENEIYRNDAFVSNTRLSVLGGSDKIRYYLGGNLMSQQGLIENNEFKRVGIVSNIDADINKWLSVGLNLTGNKESNQGVASNGYWGNPVDNALRFPNTTPVYNEDGTYATYTPIPSLGTYNPVATVFEPRRLSTSYRTRLNTYAKFQISEYLYFRTSFGTKVKTSNSDNFQTINTLNGFTNGVNSSHYYNDVNTNWQNTNTLNYFRTFNTSHTLNATLVFEQQHEDYKYTEGLVQDFPTEALGFYDLGLGKDRVWVNSGYFESIIHSFMGRINYSYLDRYLLTVSYRADGSSKFPEGNKWGYFPSASLAWRLSEEEFIQRLDVFSKLKIRTSWGVTGSQATGPYSSLGVLSTSRPYPIDGSTNSIGIGPGTPGNTALTWESTTQINLGLDMGFFKNRLSLVVDLYQKNTNDLLLDDPLPAYTGFTTIKRNIGEVENKGIEFLLLAYPFVNEFRWDISMNFSANRTKVVELGSGGQIILDEYIIREGEELGSFYGFKYLGVWKADEVDEAALYGKVPGDSKYLDMDGNYEINEDDKDIIGSGQANYSFGITNNFSYKGFDLSVEIIGVQGNQILNARRYWLNREFRVPENLNYYSDDNQDTDVPGFSNTESDPTTSNSRWLEDGSFVKLRNVSLGYSFNRGKLSKIGISNLRLYLSAQNLVTITDYSGFDPELTSFGNSDIRVGYDSSPYPSSKIFTIGLDIKF